MKLSKSQKEKIKKVLIGAGVAGAGAFLTYVSEAISGMDFGPWTPLVTAVLSVLANIVRKLAI